jgi:DNA invertase Pin-like site-specific DNA recombinase
VKAPSTANPLAYSYLRFSRDEQSKGDSIRRQNALREQWLKRHPDVQLDGTLRMVDRGVSAYSEDHWTNPRHAMAQFLDLVKRGRIEAGSYLIVENLDRLTRRNPVQSIPRVLDLIAAGIRIVQLTPIDMVYDTDMEQHHLMNMLWELARGHGESKRKSGLIGEAWSQKKENARADKTPLGKKCPAWLELLDGKYCIKEDAASAIGKIYRWCVEGLGVYRILDRLNAEGVPPFGSHKGKWERSYVQKILASPAVRGVYQPHKGSRYPYRQPEGEPVADYYPRVIEDDQWYRAQEAMHARKGKSGRVAIQKPSPFSGLLWSAIDGAKLHVHSGRSRYLVSAAALHRRSGAYRTFPLDVFTQAVLSQLRELEASELFDDPGAKKVTELTGRLHEVERRLTTARSRFDSEPESVAWADMVSQYDREQRVLVRELTEAQRAAAQPLSARWSEATALMVAQEEPDRLRAALLGTIDGIWCIFVRRGIMQLAAAQVWFKEGSHRDYLILHKPRRGNGPVAHRGQQSWVCTLADVKASDLDLRQAKDAARLEKALQAIDIEKLVEVLDRRVGQSD